MGFDKSPLRKLDRLPTDLPNPLAIASMAIQFLGSDPCVVVVSEGLDSQRWHNRVAILTNEPKVVASSLSPVLRARGRIERIISVICGVLTAEPMEFYPEEPEKDVITHSQGLAERSQ